MLTNGDGNPDRKGEVFYATQLLMLLRSPDPEATMRTPLMRAVLLSLCFDLLNDRELDGNAVGELRRELQQLRES